MRIVFRGLCALSLVSFLNSAHAWDQHQHIHQAMWDDAPADVKKYLAQIVKVPKKSAQEVTRKEIAKKLLVREAAIPIFEHSKTSVSLRDLFVSAMVDEPDFGMDQDLPMDWDAQIDSTSDRVYMGGRTGPTSQGFRHMYFAGGLQLPVRAVGKALERFDRLRALSTECEKSGDLFWAFRLKMWSLHFLQDLHQPFHVIQIPALAMLPWRTMFSGISTFSARGTQSIANFHYAYEGLVLAWVKEAAIGSFQDCVKPSSVVLAQGRVQSISDVVNEVKSLAKSRNFGSLVMDVFESEFLKTQAVDLPKGVGGVDYYALSHSLEPPASLDALRGLTCGLYQQMIARTWSELH